MSEALFGIFEPVLCRAVERQIHFPCFPQDEILGFVGDVRLCVVSVVDWIGLIFFFRRHDHQPSSLESVFLHSREE